MAQPQQNISLTAPGFAGLNTQDSPLDMDIQFASKADNCTIDRFGRIASRRGFNYLTTNPALLEGNPVKAMHEFVTADAQKWLFVCGNNKVFIQQRINPFELVELTLPTVPTDDSWQIVTFNDKCYFVQSNHQPLVFDPATPTELRLWAEYPVVTTGNAWPNAAHAAFGRLWIGALDGASTTVAWSGILNGENWSSLGEGSLETEEYWPSGFDEITSMTAHNNFMVFFGKTNILLYQTTSDVLSTLRLADTVEGLGCIARDSIIPTGQDIMFIDATGVRSLNRTIQEKSIPIGDISKNVRVEFQMALRNEQNQNDIKAVFHVEDSFYVCFLPSNIESYVFDTWSPLPDGAARCTKWNQSQPRCGVRTIDRQTYFGGNGGVYTYEGASDFFIDEDNGNAVVNDSIPMAYFTHPLDFGSAAHLIFPKQVDVTLFGGLEGDLTLNWAYDYKENFAIKTLPLQRLGKVGFWNTDDEWGTGNTIEWTATLDNLNQLKYNIWGSGRNVKVGFTTDILGSDVSVQELNIQVLQGRLL
jgi:hypothetical protein